MGGMGGMGNRGGGGMGGMNFSVPAKADVRPSEKDSAGTEKRAEKGSGTLVTAAVSLDEKWDNYFKSAPRVPQVSAEGTEEERIAKQDELRAEYENSLHQFQMGFMKEVNILMKEEKFKEAAAAIKSALRADMAASWMYEALAIALIQSKAPQAEIERAILSAAEFADDPVTVLGVAGYLETIGSNEKALELYREVSKFDPARPEPYIRSLALAKETGNEEAQKWVTLGIASGAWEGRLEADVWDEGCSLAEELIEKMKSEGREEELAAYQKELSEALVRDIVIEVRWTGDAEIDIAVKEPVNTICWFAQPRTGAGGILRTQAVEASTLEDQKAGERCKVYTCPMAFSGNYDVAVSRTWGDLPQGKVTVSIITGIGTDNEKTAVYPLELKDGKAGFSVVLENGRRSEEVKKELLTANALVDQLRVKSNKEISEKVKAFQDRSAKAAAKQASENQSYSASVSTGEKTGEVSPSDSDFETPELQYTLGSDTGYMPVINTISLGAQMQPNLGVTPDRRYVLISPNAQFSGLLRMFQYNTSSGMSSGGMGSSGGGMSGGFGGNSGMNSGSGGIAGMRGGNSGGMGNRMNGGNMGGGMNGGNMGGGNRNF